MECLSARRLPTATRRMKDAGEMESINQSFPRKETEKNEAVSGVTGVGSVWPPTHPQFPDGF